MPRDTRVELAVTVESGVWIVVAEALFPDGTRAGHVWSGQNLGSPSGDGEANLFQHVGAWLEAELDRRL